MKKINIFYIAVVLIASWLAYSFKTHNERGSISFYGFAESEETEINYNYPVVVDKILVSPGQQVNKGDTLLHISRRKSKETLEDQSYEIAILKSEENLWRQRKLDEIDAVIAKKNGDISALQVQLNELKKEQQYKQKLAQNLSTIKLDSVVFNPVKEDINLIEIRKQNIQVQADKRIASLKKELSLGKSPYDTKISKLSAERNFTESQKHINLCVIAPAEGLIGNIYCKEEEHISAYNTLLSFYEPHTGIIRGLVHESLTLNVNLGDSFEVSSLITPEIKYPGRVIGLGSRIVEIPSRLRKIPDIKTYGREVLIEISKDNEFLLKEKVKLFHQAFAKNL